MIELERLAKQLLAERRRKNERGRQQHKTHPRQTIGQLFQGEQRQAARHARHRALAPMQRTLGRPQQNAVKHGRAEQTIGGDPHRPMQRESGPGAVRRRKASGENPAQQNGKGRQQTDPASQHLQGVIQTFHPIHCRHQPERDRKRLGKAEMRLQLAVQHHGEGDGLRDPGQRHHPGRPALGTLRRPTGSPFRLAQHQSRFRARQHRSQHIEGEGEAIH